MKVLVTGNRGYVGSAVTKYLNSKNVEVYGIDNNLFSKIIKKNQTNKDIREIDGNILKNIDGVVHLAGISNDPMGKKFNKATKSINLDASIKLFKLCKKKKIKSFVFASSCSVYGQTKNNIVSENSKLNPLTDYAKSKINFEKIVTKNGIGDTNTTFLRFATACGFSDNFRRDLVINDLVLNAIKKNAENDKRSYKVDFSKFRKLSGNYYSKYNLNNIIDDLKLNLSKNKNLNSSNLIRLKKLNKLLEKKKIDNLLKWINQKK